MLQNSRKCEVYGDSDCSWERARQLLDQMSLEEKLGQLSQVNGGTHGAPKFPQPSFFRFLWRSYRRTGDIRLRDAVTKTLDAICQGETAAQHQRSQPSRTAAPARTNGHVSAGGSSRSSNVRVAQLDS